jgi:hypothetical protein
MTIVDKSVATMFNPGSLGMRCIEVDYFKDATNLKKIDIPFFRNYTLTKGILLF